MEVLGKLRGESVKMLVHHSRNSEQKQWDETLVLALSGTGRLLRAHLRTLQAVLPDFDDGCVMRICPHRLESMQLDVDGCADDYACCDTFVTSDKGDQPRQVVSDLTMCK